jgi:hypothetical protein
MAPLTYQQLQAHPELVDILHTRARRARAQALHDGVLWLAAAIKQRLSGRGSPRLPFRAHWG